MVANLVVQDSPDGLLRFRTAREHPGHGARGLTSGESLPNAVMVPRPDRVGQDIQVRGNDGFRLLLELRDQAAGKLLVMALTAHAMAGSGRPTDAGEHTWESIR